MRFFVRLGNCSGKLRAMGSSSTGKALAVVVVVIMIFERVGGQPVMAPAQPPPAGLPLPMAPAPGPSMEDLFPPCQGVLAVYETTFTKKIYPFLNDTPWIQPYKFQAIATLTNEGYSTVDNWEMGITYQHGEVSLLIIRKFQCRQCMLRKRTNCLECFLTEFREVYIVCSCCGLL